MNAIVYLTKNAQKDLNKLPRHILVLFDLWVETIESEGFANMQKIKGYREHTLKGDRKGQRLSSLNRSWRIIYQLDEKSNTITVEVLEVNHHDY
jgi:proteic killer suppression protein